MTFNTVLTITWASEEDQLHADLNEDRRGLILSMKADEQTDTEVERLDSVTSRRRFINEEAANHFIENLQLICNKHAVTPPTFVIG